MCDGTLLPHCGHLFSCEACQRFAALRMRNRIFDVLRFGTPMAGAYKSIAAPENNSGFGHSDRNRAATQPESLRGQGQAFHPVALHYGNFCGVLRLRVTALRMTPLRGSTFELQLVQRAPIRFPLRIPVFGFDLFGLANSITVSVATRMCRQVE